MSTLQDQEPTAPEPVVEDQAVVQDAPPEFEGDEYPVRDPSEDPKWALRTVWVWVGIMIFLLLFMLYLIIGGIWYD